MFFGMPLLSGQVTGIDISLSAIPVSASEVIVVVDGNGTSLRNSTATNGATSLVLRTGLPVGNGSGCVSLLFVEVESFPLSSPEVKLPA